MACETVYLDGLDGFGFEQVCERIFEKAGWGKVTRVGGVADRGRDLVIRKPDGRQIVVECKFYDGATVGRPVVQKLHSAVIDSHADGGIIITTGRFSKAAIEYAADLTHKHDSPIELFDLHKIMELAHGAGIELETGRMEKIYTYPVLDIQTAAKELRPRIDTLDSHPAHPADLMQVSNMDVVLRATYYASVSIQQSFSTTVGLIHRISVNDRPYLFDGGTGRLDPSQNARFLGRPSRAASDMPKNEHPKTEFKLDDSTLKELVTQQMIDTHTANVRYVGRNNVTYTKECAPSARNVHINNLRQVYVPVHRISLRVLECEYSCNMVGNGSDSRLSELTWNKCHECNISDGLLLCNECGRVAHLSKSGTHGFRCRKCDKTVCGRCVWRARRFLVLSSRFCSDCRPRNARRAG